MESRKQRLKRAHTVQVDMATKHLPRDRRDLQQHMVDASQGSFFVVCVKLKLFKESSIGRMAMNEFSRNLFRLVKRRHTNIWKVDANGHYHPNQWNDAPPSSAPTSEAT